MNKFFIFLRQFFGFAAGLMIPVCVYFDDIDYAALMAIYFFGFWIIEELEKIRQNNLVHNVEIRVNGEKIEVKHE